MSGPPKRSGGRVSPRAAAILVISALAVAALSVRLPQLHDRPAAEVALPVDVDTTPAHWQRADTLRRGETLLELLGRGGMSGPLATGIVSASELDARRVRAGLAMTVRGAAGDSLPNEIRFELDADRILTVRRTADGWAAEETRIPWVTDTIVVAGTIQSSLYEAIDAGVGDALPARARAELAWAVADVYEYRVDMSRELQPNDAFRVLAERSVSPSGAVRIGEILATRFELSGATVEAVRFERNGKTEYFDQNGKSMRAAFLRAPLAFRRVSSNFGMRKHPILGVWRKHTGTDYAASSGTPVRAIGDGTVIYAGRKGGYGNAIEIRHPNGFVSRYGHLRAFGKGVRARRRVGIGETIGYVGMTGLATAPHLHFEVLVNGVHRDPRRSLDHKSGQPVAAADRARFEETRALLVPQLDSSNGRLALGAN
ncbi:MAG TPA: M23 family metallopeptidase [Gemmatimonadaceae bacterium]|nr:M23 family metallopeptidase [Gemmatimonadaceae bacterium]